MLLITKLLPNKQTNNGFKTYGILFIKFITII